MNRKKYYDKLRKWEAEGYDISEFREKWFPARTGKGRSHLLTWLLVVVAVFIVVGGIVVWQATPSVPPSVPAAKIPSPTPTPATAPIPAQVAAERYTLVMSSNPEGAGSISPGSGTYDAGASVTLTATPTAGYRFDSWSGDVSSTSPTITITMNSSKSVTANFAIVGYSLKSSVNPTGSGLIYPTKGTNSGGYTLTLTAVPSSGYEFDHWSGDASGTSPTVTIPWDSNKNVIANFASIRYSLLTAVSPTGSGSISPSSGSYDSGSQVTLTAASLSGWKFDHWSGSDDNSINPTTVTMTGNKNITAFFTAQDTDGDGLTDDEERQIGTNPSYADTDHDGLNDYQEVKVKKTDPLSPDTDGDGVKDGEDLLPLHDAYVRVSIKYYEDTSTTKYAADSGLISSYADPFFKIRVNGSLQTSNMPVKMDASSLQSPFYATFNVPDNLQFASIEVEVWDYDSFSGNEQFDVGNAAGSDPDALIYKRQFNILADTITETSDGASDGSMQGPQAKIIVEISTVLQP